MRYLLKLNLKPLHCPDLSKPLYLHKQLLPSLLLSLEKSIANKETLKEPAIQIITEEDDILKDDTELIDKEMGNIIKDYPHLICLPMKKSVWIDLVLKLAKFTFRLVRKVKFMMGMKNC